MWCRSTDSPPRLSPGGSYGNFWKDRGTGAREVAVRRAPGNVQVTQRGRMRLGGPCCGRGSAETPQQPLWVRHSRMDTSNTTNPNSHSFSLSEVDVPDILP